MKRWFPLLFLCVTLLANVAERLHFDRFLDGWSPGAVYSLPAWGGLFVTFSIPASLILLWWAWRPCPQALASLSRTRRVAGNILLVLTLLLWLQFLYRALFAAWLTATPVSDPLIWKKQFARMANYAACTLGLGGTLSLWLKGVRMPPCLNRQAK